MPLPHEVEHRVGDEVVGDDVRPQPIIHPTTREARVVVHGETAHLGLNRDDALRANFVTCYQADNSIGKIRTSPLWTREDCLNALR